MNWTCVLLTYSFYRPVTTSKVSLYFQSFIMRVKGRIFAVSVTSGCLCLWKGSVLSKDSCVIRNVLYEIALGLERMW